MPVKWVANKSQLINNPNGRSIGKFREIFAFWCARSSWKREREALPKHSQRVHRKPKQKRLRAGKARRSPTSISTVRVASSNSSSIPGKSIKLHNFLWLSQRFVPSVSCGKWQVARTSCCPARWPFQIMCVRDKQHAVECHNFQGNQMLFI